MRIADDLTNRQFIQRENEIYHPTYDEELAYYDTIKSGDIAALEKKDDWECIDIPERGTLSKNPVMNLKYHMIVSVAMITRFCIEGGLNEHEAYALSDSYINRIDETNDKTALKNIHKEMSFDFAMRMREIKRRQKISLHCVKAMDYIYNHLHENIKNQDIADYIGIDLAHISKLFHREVGLTLGNFIREQKINAARNMLVYSDYSCSDIAQYFAFASNSHFTKVFKEYTGITPLQYRNKYYRTHWG